jgi:hypothetical protein
MTIDAFFALLSRLCAEGRLTFADHRGQIRAGGCNCPLVAVYRIEHPERYCSPLDFSTAASGLGINTFATFLLASAADMPDSSLRPRLLEACGLAGKGVSV